MKIKVFLIFERQFMLHISPQILQFLLFYRPIFPTHIVLKQDKMNLWTHYKLDKIWLYLDDLIIFKVWFDLIWLIHFHLHYLIFFRILRYGTSDLLSLSYELQIHLQKFRYIAFILIDRFYPFFLSQKYHFYQNHKELYKYFIKSFFIFT